MPGRATGGSPARRSRSPIAWCSSPPTRATTRWPRTSSSRAAPASCTSASITRSRARRRRRRAARRGAAARRCRGDPLHRHRLPPQEPDLRAARARGAAAASRLGRLPAAGRAARWRRDRRPRTRPSCWPCGRGSPTRCSTSPPSPKPRRNGCTARRGSCVYPTVYEGFGLVPFEAADHDVSVHVGAGNVAERAAPATRPDRAVGRERAPIARCICCATEAPRERTSPRSAPRRRA